MYGLAIGKMCIARLLLNEMSDHAVRRSSNGSSAASAACAPMCASADTWATDSPVLVRQLADAAQRHSLLLLLLQVERPLEAPMPTLSEQKVHLGGDASTPAAPKMSQASDESQAAGGDHPAIGQAAVSHLQQQAILAAAKAASDRQLVELQMRVSMLESEKIELSTQLSAAQRCMQTTESAASVADADKVDIAASNQASKQVAEVHSAAVAWSRMLSACICMPASPTQITLEGLP